jgi:hypothetical protein
VSKPVYFSIPYDAGSLRHSGDDRYGLGQANEEIERQKDQDEYNEFIV